MSNKSRRNQNRPEPGGGGDRARPQPKVGRPTRNEPVQQAVGWRRTVELRTGPLLVMLHSLPRWTLPVVLAALLFFGLLLSGTWAWLGGIFLGIIALFLAWLLFLSWPTLAGTSRLIRLVVVVAILGIAVLKTTGSF